MKSLIVLLFMTCMCLHASAQQKPDYSTVSNGTKEQKVARANEAALQSAGYLLSTPPDTSNADIKQASTYLIAWMSASEEYNFEFGNTEVQLYDGNSALLARLLAAMVEYEIKNPNDKSNTKKVQANAVRRLITYAKTPANNIKMSKALKKAEAADQKGTLEEYLASLDKSLDK